MRMGRVSSILKSRGQTTWIRKWAQELTRSEASVHVSTVPGLYLWCPVMGFNHGIGERRQAGWKSRVPRRPSFLIWISTETKGNIMNCVFEKRKKKKKQRWKSGNKGREKTARITGHPEMLLNTQLPRILKLCHHFSGTLCYIQEQILRSGRLLNIIYFTLYSVQ